VYADDFIRLVKRLVLGDGHNLAHIVWLETLSMKRSQYGTIEQFITALRDKVQHSNRVDMPITAYQAASLLLKNVHRELPNYVEARFLKLSRSRVEISQCNSSEVFVRKYAIKPVE
jgi:hypothetical protein